MSLISNEEEVMWYDKFLGYYLQLPELLLTHVYESVLNVNFLQAPEISG